ncbi:VUT family protein [Allonocardiopsis opalescens]|uniref:Vitamin uptake transporter n=1 Tax=Allonocardiopsis opalescens TaxID=1144618 RepID=A0A2T0PS84_9ACTN|nr:VUT family protein [Allonocardiopsis opalescens]PRX91763.1 hypothetical protein CLV72_11445 [Allonocardiopsis opalescens]
MAPRVHAVVLAAAYMATIPAANLAIAHIGMLPVGFGLMAPAGVYMAALALVLRDLLQEVAGWRWSLWAVLAGTVLSVAVSPTLALASGAAFLFSELADLAVYTPLRRRGLVVAMAGSNAVGLVIDSALFLWLAFGSLDFFTGQVLGKTWMTLAAIALLLLIRRTRPQVHT